MPFTVTMPKLSPTMEEGIISKWHKKEGDFVEAGELIIEVSTDKATVEYNALDEGFLRRIVAKEGESVKVNDPIAYFTETEDETFDESILSSSPSLENKVPATEIGSKPQQSIKNEEKKEERSGFERILASPLAKKIAKDKGVNLQKIEGSGPRGRIVSRDIQSIKKDSERESQVKKHQKSSAPFPEFEPGSYEKVPLTPIRKIIAERLTESKSTIPHFYVKQTIIADQLVKIREQLKTFDIKVSFNDFVIRAVALALKNHPDVNAGFDSDTSSILSYKSIDVSVAVSIPGGLITPIITSADQKDIQEISQEMKALADKARIGKLQEHEYKGGSFSISNMGMYGIDEFTAIINPPQAAILAVGSIREVPLIKDTTIIVGKAMTCVLSIDHRVIDGTKAAEFMKTLQQLLENPALLLV